MVKSKTKSNVSAKLKDEWEDGVNPVVKTPFFKFVIPTIIAITVPLFAYFTLQIREAGKAMEAAATNWQEDSFIPTPLLSQPVAVYPPDLIFKFTPSGVFNIFASSGPEAISIYLNKYRRFDDYLPLIYAPMFYAVLGYTFVPRIKKRSESLMWIIYCPLATAICDAFENMVLSKAARIHPDIAEEAWLKLAANAGMVKHVLTYFMMGATLGTWLSMLIYRIRGSRGSSKQTSENKDE
ncbi:hypothetical protein HK098_000982 [Nowakowskiella sp. JEL0407]|nr:hypothetical protein HK098_000982 [Nowakowskiella sp. JEL0407]